jgi:phosphopantetheinyl transferase
MPLIFKQLNNNYSISCWRHTEDIAFFEKKMSYRSNASHPERKKQQLSSRMAINELDPYFPFDQVVQNDNGKPYLISSGISFSLTHSKEMAGAIISENHEVGIDIEKISDRVLKVEKKFLHPYEILMLPEEKTERIRLLTLMWSVKETVFKCFGLPAIDFSDHIRINTIGRDYTEIKIDFKPLEICGASVFCRFIEEHWLTYMVYKK